MPSIWIVDYPWYDGCLRSLGRLLLERLQSWVDQSATNKVNFLNVAAQRVTTLVIAWNAAAKIITLIVAPSVEVVATLIKVVASLIKVVASLVEVVATALIKVVAAALIEVASLVCAKDAFQETVPGLHLLPWSSI